MALAEAPIAPTAIMPAEAEGLTPAQRRHLVSLERKIESGLDRFKEVGKALLEIRESRLYRETHTSFEVYCADKWGLDKPRAYQFIGAAEVIKVLGEDSVQNEAQARELVPVMHESPQLLPRVWAEVRNKSEAGAPVTAALIRQTVREMQDVTTTPAPTATDRLVSLIARCASDYQRWLSSHPGRRDKAAVKGAMDRLLEVAG